MRCVIVCWGEREREKERERERDRDSDRERDRERERQRQRERRERERENDRLTVTKICFRNVISIMILSCVPVCVWNVSRSY